MFFFYALVKILGFLLVILLLVINVNHCVCVNFLPVHVYLSLDDVSFWLCALHWFENTFFSLDTVMTLSVHALKILLIAGEVLVV